MAPRTRQHVPVIEETDSGITLFKARNPCFIRPLNSSNKYHQSIPEKISRAVGVKEIKSLKLKVNGIKKSWIVETKTTKDGRMKMSTGWVSFYKCNDISFGDKIVFEFVRPAVIRVFIFGGDKEVILVGPKVVNFRQS